MLLNDIDCLKQKLYCAMDEGDDSAAYDISLKLDILIVEFYKTFRFFDN